MFTGLVPGGYDISATEAPATPFKVESVELVDALDFLSLQTASICSRRMIIEHCIFHVPF